MRDEWWSHGPRESDYDENLERATREAMATDIVEGWRRNPSDPAYKLMQEWTTDVMPDSCPMYACAILNGGDALASATGTMWRDAVGWIADYLDDSDVQAELDGVTA